MKAVEYESVDDDETEAAVEVVVENTLIVEEFAGVEIAAEAVLEKEIEEKRRMPNFAAENEKDKKDRRDA